MIVIARFGIGKFLSLGGKEYKITNEVAKNLVTLGIDIKYEWRNKW